MSNDTQISAKVSSVSKSQGEFVSPNMSIEPVSAKTVNDHLSIGGCDTVELAKTFGTPLWIMDEQTIVQSVLACKAGLSGYPQTQVFYAGKAFLCLAICHLIKNMNVGLDVVSEGELYTAVQADMPAKSILLHGNNKSQEELNKALEIGARIVVDNLAELKLITQIAKTKNTQAKILVRVIPGVTGDTHQHIQTGQEQSKFGIALSSLPAVVSFIEQNRQYIKFLGLHSHIGSQIHKLQPFTQTIEILAKTYASIKDDFGLTLGELNVGGGLGIAYTAKDKPIAIETWSRTLAQTVMSEFNKYNLPLPILLVEPGRALVGTAGVTLYQVGFDKWTSNGTHYVALNGGMADNPRPVTYQALYTACLANRMGAPKGSQPITLVGKYCEQGDIIIKESLIAPEDGDLVAIFDTGAYNASMASNYNRTGRPACVLVADGKAEIIIERETNTDLIDKDKVPKRLLKDSP